MSITLIEGRYYWIKFKEGKTSIIGRCEKSWGNFGFYVDGRSDFLSLDRVDVLSAIDDYE